MYTSRTYLHFLWHRFLNSSTVGDMKLFQPAYMDAFALDPMILYT